MSKNNELSDENKKSVNKIIKPLEKKIHSLSDYKAEKKLDDGVKDKPLEYIPLSSAFQKVTGITGVPKGTVSIFRGHSNTGKSTALIETAVGCQRLGIVPIIIDTENSWNWEHAREIGLDYEEICDEETGEVINYSGFFIYINNDYLIEHFGKKRDKNCGEAVVEDVAQFINEILDDQIKGRLNHEVCFLFDSVGTLNCQKGVESKSANNQWIAGAYESEFRSILNYRIPASKKDNKKYTNTMVVVNKIWVDNMGMGVLKNKGGNAFGYAARIQILFGGTLGASTKKLVAKSNGKEFTFGIQTKVKIEKNHITNTTFSGELVSTSHGFILPSEVDAYKKEHKDYILSQCGVMAGSSNTDITYTEVDEADESDIFN